MLKLLKNFKLRDWLVVLFSTGFIVLQVWLDLKIPDYMKEITELVQRGGLVKEVWILGGFMLLCAVGSGLSAVVVGFFGARLAANFSKDLRHKLFSKVEAFSMEEINRFSTASLITRSTNDITQVQMIIAMGMQLIIKAPIMAVWAITKIAGKSWQWTIVTAVAVILMLVMITVIILVVMPKFTKVQKLTDNLNMSARENLTGVRVVRAYNAENYMEEKFNKANVELTKTNLFANRMMGIMQPSMNMIMNGLSLSIYWIGAILINAALPIGDKLNLFSDMVIFSQYAMQVVMSFMMLGMIFIMMPRASVSAKRINEVLNTAPTITDGALTESVIGKVGEIEFRNVCFKYPDAEDYVLKDVNLKISKGETVAFIGSTGSGKSTLINLVPRFYDVTEGDVIVDGVNVKDFTLSALHDKLGYVSQKVVMFSGTVKSNVNYGTKAAHDFTDEGVMQAVSIAQGTDFVEKMDNQYDSRVSQGGTNISGGQKQRLAIARAIARRPEIYIFDDSFSALDYRTDKLLRGALRKEMSGATSLIVAQRIGTIRDADKIVVLDSGSVVGMGTHKELLGNCEVYREIASSQLSKEELENE